MTAAHARLERDDGEAGFTLVEFLVALALFSLLTTLLFGSVRTGVQAWQRGSARTEHVEHGLVAQDLLRRMIGNIYPMLATSDAAQPRIDFDGASDAISFLGDAPIAASSGGHLRFRLLLERRQNRADLVISATPELAGSQGAEAATRTLLLSGIDRAEFAYFGEGRSERSLQWQDSWAGRNDLPRLVRIRIAFRAGDARPWPELVIAPRVNADVGCIFDPVTKRCRGR
jgi:general secretion pathway protein J